jgi:hypothetical protein
MNSGKEFSSYMHNTLYLQIYIHGIRTLIYSEFFGEKSTYME